MEINQLPNQFKSKNIDKLIELLQTLNQTDSNTKEKLSGHAKKQAISHQLLSLLKSLPPATRENLLNTWLKMNLPLTEKVLSQIIKIINSNPESQSINPQHLIKASALIQKNGLPLIPGLVKGLANNLSTESNLSTQISQLDNLNKNELLQLLGINPSLHSDQIANKLKNYGNKLIRIIDFLGEKHFKKGDKTTLKFINNLQGQLLLNQMEGPLLLALEIPIHWLRYKDHHPLYLEIWKGNKNNNEEEKEEEVYTLNFNIELKNLGVIQAAIILNNRQIEGFFQTEYQHTAKLIKDNFKTLQGKLKKLDYHLSEPNITVNINIENKYPILSQTSDPNNTTYTPIDFLI